MLFFRKRDRQTKTAAALGDLAALVSAFEAAGKMDHDDSLELLIQYGEFESGVLDRLYPETDGYDRTANMLRRAGHLTGRIFFRTWTEKEPGSIPGFLARLTKVLNQLRSLSLPEKIVLRVPEGYAHYGLYPEMYLEAAQTFFEEQKPERVVCIGMRSIGASLSSVVASSLEEFGSEVYSFTVRPRGEPYTRRAKICGPLEHSLRSLQGAVFIIVDEGPGLSGSSICCTAERLSELGIQDERIVFFPSWEPDGERFISLSARARWPRHRKYTGTFECVKKRLRSFPGLPSAGLIDISAGHWRSLFFGNEEEHYPPVHPRHEKRKFLCYGPGTKQEGSGFSSAEGTGAVMLKFAGLGKYGRAKFARAQRLHDAGFSPAPAGIDCGFLATNFVEGTPVSGYTPDHNLLARMVKYLSFVKTEFPSDQKINFDEMLAMVRRNTMLGLGHQWANRLACLEKFRPVYDDLQPVAIDGRMLPQEWIAANQGYLKTDALDHHADQFFPGSQDICWDVAGMIIEFGLDTGAQEYCLNLCSDLMKDEEMAGRLPFYKIAYLGFRLGFATFAVQDLAPSPDSERFQLQRDRYALQLKNEIARIAVEQYTFSAI